jgi:hypothetical protein
MRRALALTLLLLASVVLPACGNDDAEVGPLAAAAERSGNEESAKWDMEMDVDSSKEGKFSMTGTALMTADSSRGRMDMNLEIPGEDPVKMEMINIRDEFWMRSPAFDLPAGKKWMHSVDRGVAPSTMTMREFLDLIRESGDVDELGGERVRGRATTHYKATVSMDDLFERSPDETKRRFREKFKQFEGKGLEFPIEVWIDDEELVRRMVIDWKFGKDRMHLAADILDYGVNVPSAPPDESTVVEESEVPG